MTKFRVLAILDDGRKVYYTKRDRIEICTEAEKKILEEAQRGVSRCDGDPMVFAKDLSIVGNRSIFLRTLRPFAMIIEKRFEDLDAPLDPDAIIMNGRPASEGLPYI